MFTQSKSKPNTEERSKLWCHKWFHAIKCLLRHLGKAMYPIAMQLVCPCMSARPRGVRSYCADRRRLLSLTERGTALVSAFPTEEERRVSGNMKTKTEELWLTNGVNSVHLVSRGAIINKKHSHTPSLFFGIESEKEWMKRRNRGGQAVSIQGWKTVTDSLISLQEQRVNATPVELLVSAIYTQLSHSIRA